MSRILQPRWVLLSYWFAVIVSTLLLYPSSNLDRDGVWIIFVLVGGFTLGVMIASAKSVSTDFELVKRHPKRLDRKLIVSTAMIGGAANFGAAFLALRSSNGSLVNLLTLQGLLDSSNAISVNRYGSSSTNPLTAALLGVAYVAALVAPFVRLTDAKRKSWIMIFPSLTSLTYASVTTARLGFLVSVALTAGGVVACHVFESGKTPQVPIRAVLSSFLAICLAGGSFVGIAILRTGRMDAETVKVVLDKQIVYSLGGPGAFSVWYRQHENDHNTSLGFGTASIAGVEFLTGKNRNVTRAYGEFVAIDAAGRTSNVYTAFRGLLLDFGEAGTLIVMTLLGFAFGWLYRSTLRGSIFSASILGFAYGTILLSAWLATTTFSNVCVAALAAPIVLHMAHKRGLGSGKTKAAKRTDHLAQCGQGAESNGALQSSPHKPHASISSGSSVAD